MRNRAEFEHGARTDDPFRRHPVPVGDDRHDLGYDVDWIGRYQKDRILRCRQYRRHDVREDFGVARQEVKPGLPGPLAGARSEDDDLRAVEIGRPAGAEPDGMREGRALQDVARLRRRQNPH